MGEPTAIAVHRCRFVDYNPSAITAVAFPPSPLPPATGKNTSIGNRPSRFGTLAVGHANGNIDLYEWVGHDRDSQCTQAWVVRKTLTGLHPSKVDSITFVIRHPDDFQPEDVPFCSDLRLFSAGGGSELLEWDMDQSSVRRTISSQGGSIWCMAANPASNLLALGCEDGTVRLLSLVNDTLSHFRRFDRVKCRLLSVAWGPPAPQPLAKRGSTARPENGSSNDDDDDNWVDNWLVTGGSDSSVRKWDVSTGRVVDRMGTDKIRGERTLVWTVGVIGDGTIVSGDSLGMVKFWDSRTCTQLQSFQAHSADVLCLTIGPEGKTVFTSGVDQKTCQFTMVKTVASDKSANALVGSSSRWIQACSRRMHSHDVRALATWPPYTTLPSSHKRHFPVDIAPILASGGLDMSVVLTPAALPSATVVKVTNPLATSTDCTFEDSYHRRLAYTSGPSCTSAIQVARHARLVSCMRDSGLSVWRIPVKRSPLNDEDVDEDISNVAGWEKVLEMDFKVQTNLVASAISDDGHWLVVSDLRETKLFSLIMDRSNRLHLKRIRDLTSTLAECIPKSISSSTGGLGFRFTPDSSKLIMSTAATACILVIDLSGDKLRVLRRFDHHRRRPVLQERVVKGRKGDGDGSVDIADLPVDSVDENKNPSTPVSVNVLRMSISPDGQWLASSDDHSRTHVFNLDSIQHHCVLPSFSKPAQALCFDPAHPSILMMAFPDNSLQVYDVESRQFPPWGKQLCSNLPKRFTHAHDPILGIAFDPIGHSTNALSRHALFWGSTWMCKLPLTGSLGASNNKKRRRESMKRPALPPTSGVDDPGDFKMITHYRPILFVDYLAAGELVVVERPLIDVLSTLPPAYFKHKYGAS